MLYFSLFISYAIGQLRSAIALHIWPNASRLVKLTNRAVVRYINKIFHDNRTKIRRSTTFGIRVDNNKLSCFLK